MRILALAPHTDDVALGAGGCLAKLSEIGHTVSVLALSTGNPKTGSNEHEFRSAMRNLGVQLADALDYQCRRFPVMRQDILLEIEEQLDMIEPSLLIIPARHDHQDHRIVYEEACRVSRLRSLSMIAYEQPWNHLMDSFHPTMFISLGNRHIVAKVKALACFKSQLKKFYMQKSYVTANAVRWGAYTKSTFAEAYEVVKWVM